MFLKRFKILTLAGFPVYIDLSWFVIAVLIVWSLATGVFPMRHEGLSETSAWIMGAAGALGLFASIVLHELGHAIAARRCRVRIRAITLFLFGGVAEMQDEPPSAKAELLIALAGPLVSVALAVAGFAAGAVAAAIGARVEITGVLSYLGAINALLVAFNMLPAFPLDGGRALRAALWWRRDNLRSATRTTSRLGALFGAGFVGLGVASVLLGEFVGGMWWFLIGLFLRRAAHASYEQLLIRRSLEGEPVARFATSAPVTASPDLTLRELVDEYLCRTGHKMYPVTRNGELLGCVTLERLKSIPQREWERRRVGEIVQSCGADNVVDADSDAMEALSTMHRTGQSRLMVVDDGRLVGVLTLKDLMRMLSTKVELEALE